MRPPQWLKGQAVVPHTLNDPCSTKTTVVGMYIGVAGDSSGAKLSKLVPSRLIHEAVSKLLE